MKRSQLLILGVTFLMVIMMTALVFGCSSPSTPAPTTSSTPPSTTSSSPAPTTPSPVSGEVIKLTFSTQWPEAGPNWQKQFKLIIEEMEAKSNGRLKITPYPGGALGKNEEQYDIARTGKADMVHISTGYTPGRFPLSEIMTLPLAYESTVAHQEMVDAVGQRILYKDFPDTHIVEFNQSQMFYLYTNKPITKLEDYAGMKTRSSGAMVTSTVQALGGVPVSMGLGDLYLSLQTGVVDASITGPSGLFSFSLQEVVKHELKVNLGCTSQIWAVNLKTWNSLPADIQQIITETAKKVGKYEVDLFNEDGAAMSKLLVEKGGTSAELSPQEYERWVEKLAPVVDNYLKELKAKGLPADELMSIIREESQKRNLDFPY